MEINDKLKGLLWGLLLCGLLTLLFGCRTKYVAVPEVHVRDSVQTRLVRDSVFLHDSVFVYRYTQGDTVFKVKEKYVTRWRNLLQIDTVSIMKRDTVRMVYNTEADTKKPLPWYERLVLSVGTVAVFAGLAWIIVFVLKRLGKN